MQRIIVTGCAGFIGFHLSQKLLSQGYNILGIDNLNPYYDVNLKHARLSQIKEHENFTFLEQDIAEREAILETFQSFKPDYVVHLAAQAGVRYSITHPEVYTHSNLVGFSSVIDAARQCDGLKHFLYASSSSVYGANKQQPFSESDSVSHPLSLYAATKKSNELVAHSYANIYGLPSTGLRFFTVYGPWGRPDMALFLFTQKILNDEPIPVFNHGKMRRDFTYVDDIVDGISRLIPVAPEGNPKWDGVTHDPHESFVRYKVYNIGNSEPVELMDYIAAIEQALDKKAILDLLPMQKGDVPETSADVSYLHRDISYKPSTPVTVGVKRFVEWYLSEYDS